MRWNNIAESQRASAFGNRLCRDGCGTRHFDTASSKSRSVFGNSACFCLVGRHGVLHPGSRIRPLCSSPLPQVSRCVRSSRDGDRPKWPRARTSGASRLQAQGASPCKLHAPTCQAIQRPQWPTAPHPICELSGPGCWRCPAGPPMRLAGGGGAQARPTRRTLDSAPPLALTPSRFETLRRRAASAQTRCGCAGRGSRHSERGTCASVPRHAERRPVCNAVSGTPSNSRDPSTTTRRRHRCLLATPSRRLRSRHVPLWGLAAWEREAKLDAPRRSKFRGAGHVRKSRSATLVALAPTRGSASVAF